MKALAAFLMMTASANAAVFYDNLPEPFHWGVQLEDGEDFDATFIQHGVNVLITGGPGETVIDFSMHDFKLAYAISGALSAELFKSDSASGEPGNVLVFGGLQGIDIEGCPADFGCNFRLVLQAATKWAAVVNVVPIPPAAALLGLPLLGMWWRSRRAQRS